MSEVEIRDILERLGRLDSKIDRGFAAIAKAGVEARDYAEKVANAAAGTAAAAAEALVASHEANCAAKKQVSEYVNQGRGAWKVILAIGALIGMVLTALANHYWK